MDRKGLILSEDSPWQEKILLSSRGFERSHKKNILGKEGEGRERREIYDAKIVMVYKLKKASLYKEIQTHVILSLHYHHPYPCNAMT